MDMVLRHLDVFGKLLNKDSGKDCGMTVTDQQI
jgi:hypothetical protein